MKAFTAEPKAVEEVVQVMRLLSDATRIKLLRLLNVGERNVTTLCKELEAPQPTISHHLGLLRTAGLVENRRHGKQVIYSLNHDAVSELGDRSGLAITTGPIELRLFDEPNVNGSMSMMPPEREGSAA